MTERLGTLTMTDIYNRYPQTWALWSRTPGISLDEAHAQTREQPVTEATTAPEARVVKSLATVEASRFSRDKAIAERVLAIRAAQPGVTIAQAEKQARQDVAYARGEDLKPTVAEYAAMDPVTKEAFDKANGLTDAAAFDAFEFAPDEDDEPEDEFTDEQLDTMLGEQQARFDAKAEQKVIDAREHAVRILMTQQGIDYATADSYVAPLDAFRPAKPKANATKDAFDKVTREDMGLQPVSEAE